MSLDEGPVTIEFLHALDRAIASGALEVWYQSAGTGQKRVVYDSFEGLVKRRNYIASILGLSGAKGRRCFADFRSGLEK